MISTCTIHMCSLIQNLWQKNFVHPPFLFISLIKNHHFPMAMSAIPRLFGAEHHLATSRPKWAARDATAFPARTNTNFGVLGDPLKKNHSKITGIDPLTPKKKNMTPDAIDLEYSKGCPPWFGHILRLRPGYAWPLRGTQHRVYARPGAIPLGDRTSTLRHPKMTHPLIIHLTMRFRRRFLEGIIHATQGELLVPCLGKFQAGKETCRVHGMVAKVHIAMAKPIKDLKESGVLAGFVRCCSPNNLLAQISSMAKTLQNPSKSHNLKGTSSNRP